MKRLGDAELEIMLVIWEHQVPLTSKIIHHKIQEKRKWQLSTLMTSLKRLSDKGYLICEKENGMNVYSATISKDEYRTHESKTFLEKIYGNSIKNLVATLYSGKVIETEQLQELKEYIDGLSKNEEDK